MHKSMRQRVQKAKRIEAKIKFLAFSINPEARKESKRMAENRHWYDRELKGELRCAREDRTC